MMKKGIFISGVILMVASGYAMDQDAYLSYEYVTKSQNNSANDMVKQISFTFESPYDKFGDIISNNESLDDLGGRFREFMIQEYPETAKFYMVCAGLKKQCEIQDQDYYPQLHTLLVTLENNEPREKIEKLLKDLPHYALVQYYTEDQSKSMRQLQIFESLKPRTDGCSDCVII